MAFIEDLSMVKGFPDEGIPLPLRLTSCLDNRSHYPANIGSADTPNWAWHADPSLDITLCGWHHESWRLGCSGLALLVLLI